MAGCTTDVEVLGEYKETPVVYGLLDENDSVTSIRISRTFQVNGPASEGMQDAEAQRFRDIGVSLRNADGREVNLVYNTSVVKDPGPFSNQYANVYSAPAGFRVKAGETWKLRISRGDNPELCAGETRVIGGFGFMANYVPSPAADGNNILHFDPTTDTYAADVVIELRYRVSPKSDPSSYTDHTLRYPVVTGVFIDNPLQSPELSAMYVGRDLVQALRAAVLYDSLNTIRILGLDYVFTAGDRSVRDYISLFTPSSDFGQKSRQYSNLDHGLGLFASRHTRMFSNVPLSPSLNSTFHARIPELIP
jgi:hypothetical protein